MKTLTRTSKAMMFVLVAMLLCVATVFAACNPTGSNDDGTVGNAITQYDADLDASITMGAMGSIDFGNSLVETSYVTAEDGKYSLTLIFKAGTLTVGIISQNIFVDDDPENAATNNGIKEGTIGVYAEDGTLMTDGVSKTYSSGENYLATPSGKNVYYVQSATIPVDGLRASYDMTLFVNSPIMGAQFSNDTYKATLNQVLLCLRNQRTVFPQIICTGDHGQRQRQNHQCDMDAVADARNSLRHILHKVCHQQGVRNPHHGGGSFVLAPFVRCNDDSLARRNQPQRGHQKFP